MDSPEAVYLEPKTAFVADFISGVNLLDSNMPVRNPHAVGSGPWTGTVVRAIFLGHHQPGLPG